ncbi:glycoside hydrolase family 43 protein [Alkalitalea saponilacus]|uniref:Beta-xylosidase n=1 Tax=Alkalitalea saponilacus TaxID=889453 RepID=A0A1T5AAP1_9BACT|nr:glycoside hydrolase 43 family protein [Alkalitalea saponilacus]ASB48767.1 glycoside hydrolase [Alkalitalea saponilacus]SKB32008.1 Beta-xylosidase [Alkalitalea saponilacus]
MKTLLSLVLFVFLLAGCKSQANIEEARDKATNPVVWADIPDMSIVLVDDTYYMASTTMHMSPGLPIMKSKDLVNWEIVSYAYDILVDNDRMSLRNGESAYGNGSWAPSLRYHNGVFYASTFSATSGKTHIYKTTDIENGTWEEISFRPSIHDHSLFFDDDGKVYLIAGVGRITMVELKEDLSGVKEGSEVLLIENASAPAGDNIMLPAEGSQMFKFDGKYYLFNITWVRGGMRKVIIHKADQITGPYEGRLALRDRGIAQGGLIETTEGDWVAFLFRDFGSVGRIPYMVPAKWEDGWPVLGVDGVVPDTLDIPVKNINAAGIVASDNFERESGDNSMPLVWQWNHNPVNEYWTLQERKGYFRLKTSRVDENVLQARNTLTQRTFGPESSASTVIDVSNMKDGDFAGMIALQRRYGFVGVSRDGNSTSIIMVSNESEEPVELERIELNQDKVYLKIACDYNDRNDKAYFYYSLDGQAWTEIGESLQMAYTLPHFMGYRFGLFNYATKSVGGYVDFGHFEISDSMGGN